MLNALTDEKGGAITIETIDKAGLDKSLAKAPARERAWFKTLGFTAEAGKFVFVPGSNGRPGKVIVGADLSAILYGRWPDCPTRCQKADTGSMLGSIASARRRSRSGGRWVRMRLHAIRRQNAPSQRSSGQAKPTARRSSGWRVASFWRAI